MRRYEVLVSGAARQMLYEHMLFLAQVSPEAAKQLKADVESALRGLETLPERNPYLEPENRKSAYRKLFVPRWYLLVYLVEGERVYVEYVVDCRQDNRWLLER